MEPSGAFTNVKDIGQTVISLPRSNQVAYLRDVAKVRRATVDPPNQLAYYNGQRAIVLAVSMTEGENVVEFGKRLQKRITQLQNRLPWGYRIQYATAQAPRVEVAIRDFSSNLYQTIIIVLVVVMFALGMRTGLIVGISVPVTMLLAIIIMRMVDVELQRVSLAALMISLGMLVDNGIVVAEDINPHFPDDRVI